MGFSLVALSGRVMVTGVLRVAALYITSVLGMW
jgi:hypothetical protein